MTRYYLLQNKINNNKRNKDFSIIIVSVVRLRNVRTARVTGIGSFGGVCPGEIDEAEVLWKWRFCGRGGRARRSRRRYLAERFGARYGIAGSADTNVLQMRKVFTLPQIGGELCSGGGQSTNQSTKTFNIHSIMILLYI